MRNFFKYSLTRFYIFANISMLDSKHLAKGGLMYPLIIGFLCGAASGVIMGLLSHVLFLLKVFKSSLIIVDGSFFFRTLKINSGSQSVFTAGLLMHLITSGVFGAIYILATSFLKLEAMTVGSFFLISLYIGLLYFSMLIIALPVAGEGFLGKKSGPFTWFEQLILHIVFALLYYGCLKIFLL